MTGTIGIIGGGQLGRMLTQAALPLGFRVVVVDPAEDCPAGQVGAEQIRAPLSDTDAIDRLAAQCDVVTWEIEHIPASHLQTLAVTVEPSPATLATVQDKLAQKQLLAASGIPVGPFAPSVDPGRAGGFVVKARFGGFDGRANLVLDTLDDAAVARAFGDAPVYVEDRLPFDRELAVIVARDRAGRSVAYPLVETVHVNGICDTVTAPAAVAPRVRAAAEEVARATLAVLDGAGVFAIELFVVGDDVFVNEIAPRVHNSGHLTIEACATSQFEQHVRAVAGLPLGATDLRVPAATMVNLIGASDEPLGRDGLAGALALLETHLHLYGKDQRPARKIGHITALGTDPEETTARALRARKELGL